MKSCCFIAGATLWLAMSASAQVQYQTQARSVKAQSAGMPSLDASASDFGLFNASLRSVGTPPLSTGIAVGSQNSLLLPMQMRCSGGADRGKSIGTFSGYGTAFSKHQVKFSVPTDTPVNFISSISYGTVSLSGPGVNFVHSFMGSNNESGTLLAGQTYTVSGETYGEIQVGNAIPGSYSYTLTLGVPAPAPLGGSVSGSGVCPGTAVVLTAIAPPAGYVIDWYSVDNEYLGTGLQITVYPTTGPTTYYHSQTRRLSDNAVSINRALFQVQVMHAPTPASVSLSRNNICQYDIGQIVLNASTTQGGTYVWYAGECGGTPIGTGNPLIITVPHVTTTYYVRMENDCMVGACASRTVTVRNCPGDFNCSGTVEDGDFGLFASSYNRLLCSDPFMMFGCPADMNADGMVDDSDFVLFATAYDALNCP